MGNVKPQEAAKATANVSTPPSIDRPCSRPSCHPPNDAGTRGSVKAPDVAYLQSYGYITHEGTPHPPPCGPPSPQWRGIEIRIEALSPGERGDRKAVGEGSISSPVGL